jgi:hypothetical protein
MHLRDVPVRASLAALFSLAVGCGAARSAPEHVGMLGACVAGRDGCVAVLDDGALVTEYVYRDVRVPCLYPLNAPGNAPGGVPMTRGFPLAERPNEEHDHPHQVSLWFAHGDVNGHDFWQDPDNRIVNGDAILCDAGSGKVRVRARNLWLAQGELILIEDRVMTFRLADDRRVIDFDFKLSPAGEAVTFGDTSEGAFAIRMNPELRLQGPVAKGSARNSEGVTGADVWGKRARWIAYWGPVEGQAVTLAMMDHPQNPRFPTWWHARDYGLCAANPFGIHAFEDAAPAAGALRIGAGEKLRLRYRVVLRSGELDVGDVEDDWEEWAD